MEERKEIQLVDPLYEPIIMYPPESGKTQIICEEGSCKLRSHDQKWHIQKLVRDDDEGWRRTIKATLKLEQIEKCVKEEFKPLMTSPERSIRILYKPSEELEELIEGDANDVSKLLKTIGIKKERFDKYERKERKIESCVHCGKPLNGSRYVLNSNTALKELYDLYNELVNTFEMQRLMHLQMTGFLSLKYPSSTHTRFAHVVGTWIGGLIALQNVTVVTGEREEKRLIEFLADEDMHREFMAALILHDIGHAPFSHVLEMNPHLKYDHEEVTKELIEGGDSYLKLEDLLVSSYVDLEYGFGEEYGIYPGILENYCGKYQDKIRNKEKFVLVYDVIESMGLDEKIIIELFTNHDSKDPAVNALRGLVHGVVDIDRIDHIYRDLHYNSFKTMGIPLTSLFHGMRVHYGDALKKKEKPYITISEEITPIVETLLGAREQSNKAIFNNPVNNFYIGALNAAISYGVMMMPLLKYYIPYLTDDALLHILTNKNLFHNLSPTENVGIITGSSFGHCDYKYSTYKIRTMSEEKNEEKIPGKELKDDILNVVSEVAEEGGMIWYTFLKDVRGSYNIGKNSTPICIGEGEKKENKFKDRFEPYIDGITNDGNEKQSYTFTLFAKMEDESEIEEAKENIEGKLKLKNSNLYVFDVVKSEWVR